MSADKLPPFMSPEYFAEPANVLLLIAAQLNLATEELDGAAIMERPHEKLAQISVTLQLLADVAEKASRQARLWSSLNVDERGGVRALLRQPSAAPDSCGEPQAKGG